MRPPLPRPPVSGSGSFTANPGSMNAGASRPQNPLPPVVAPKPMGAPKNLDFDPSYDNCFPSSDDAIFASLDLQAAMDADLGRPICDAEDQGPNLNSHSANLPRATDTPNSVRSLPQQPATERQLPDPGMMHRSHTTAYPQTSNHQKPPVRFQQQQQPAPSNNSSGPSGHTSTASKLNENATPMNTGYRPPSFVPPKPNLNEGQRAFQHQSHQKPQSAPAPHAPSLAGLKRNAEGQVYVNSSFILDSTF